eukprot:gene17931-21389_t
MTGANLATVLQACYNQVLRGDTAQSSGATTLDFRKWSLGSVERAKDLTFCGPFLGSPFRALPYGTTEHSMVRLVVVGRDPIVSFYYPADDGGTSFSVAVALVSSVAAKLTNAVYSFAKNWWGGSPKLESQPQQQQLTAAAEQRIENAAPLSIRWSIMDEKRELQSVVLDPSGRYAATTDNLGRVLLVDVVNSIIVKVWKGYRDCQCAWINKTIEDDEDDDDEAHHSPDTPTLADFIPPKLLKKRVNGRPIYRTYLAIYIGRRGYLEVWGMKHQSRVVFQKVGLGCRLLSATVPTLNTNAKKSSTTNSNTNTTTSTPQNYSSHCFLVNQDGDVNEVVIV